MDDERIETTIGMSFHMIIERLNGLEARFEHQEKALQALPPLLGKIIAHLEAQAQKSEVPVASCEQIYKELEEAPTLEVAPPAPVAGTPLPRPRGPVWRWFHEEKKP